MNKEHVLHSLIEAVPDLIYVKDRSGAFIVCNHACAFSLGAKGVDDLIGKRDSDFVGPELAELYHQDDERVMSTGVSMIDRQEPANAVLGKREWLSTTKVPLRDENGQVVGVIGISRNVTHRKETAEQLDMYAKKLEEKTAEMERNIRVAGNFWRAIVPDRTPEIPISSSLYGKIFLEHKYIPSDNIGGDYFDITIINDHQIGIFVSDVTGHDVRASLAAATLNGMMQEIGDVIMDPGGLMSRINQSFRKILAQSSRDLFVTAFYALIDLEKKEVLYSNAGHPDGMLVRRSEQCVLALTGDQPALGLVNQMVFETERVALKSGDLLALYTDGMVEAENAQHVAYGPQRLGQYLLEHDEHDLPTLLDECLKDIKGHSFSGKYEDDICLAVAAIGEL